MASILAISCEELTHWKRPWCWEGLGARGGGDDRVWDGWMASPTWWTWVWVNSGSLWWTGRPGVLQFMGSQSIGHNWATELNWTELRFSQHDIINALGQLAVRWLARWAEKMKVCSTIFQLPLFASRNLLISFVCYLSFTLIPFEVLNL